MAEEGNEDSWLYGSNPEGAEDKENTGEGCEKNRDEFDIDKRREEDERPQQDDSNTFEGQGQAENGANEDQTAMVSSKKSSIQKFILIILSIKGSGRRN